MVDVLVGAAVVVVAVGWVYWNGRAKPAPTSPTPPGPPPPPSENERFVAVLEAAADLPWHILGDCVDTCSTNAAPLIAEVSGKRWSVWCHEGPSPHLRARAPDRLAHVLDAALAEGLARRGAPIDAVEKKVREAVEAQARLALRKLGEGG